MEQSTWQKEPEEERIKRLCEEGLASLGRIVEAADWWNGLPEKRLDWCGAFSLVAVFGKWVMDYFDPNWLRNGMNFVGSLAILSEVYGLEGKPKIGSADELAEATSSPTFLGGFVFSRPYGPEKRGHVSGLLPGRMVIPVQDWQEENEEEPIPVRVLEGLIMVDGTREMRLPEEFVRSSDEVFEMAEPWTSASEKKMIFLLFHRDKNQVLTSPSEEIRGRLQTFANLLREHGDITPISENSSNV